MEERTWEQQEGESHMHYMRFLVYRNLGHNRSILGAYNEDNKAKPSHSKPSKYASGAWKEVADKWQWRSRAEEYDRYMAAEEDRRREEILSSGLALMHNRVLAAKEISDLTLRIIKDKAEHGIINAREHEITQNWLDAIAQEKGERQKASSLALSGSIDISDAKESLLQKLSQAVRKVDDDGE